MSNLFGISHFVLRICCFPHPKTVLGHLVGEWVCHSDGFVIRTTGWASEGRGLSWAFSGSGWHDPAPKTQATQALLASEVVEWP